MEESQKSTPKFDRSDLISVLAFFLSLAAFGVTLYEANILKKQQMIMQSEQKASFWPYLEFYPKYDFDETTMKFSLSLTNKGVGPAIIDQVHISVNGQSAMGFNHMDKAIQQFFKLNETVLTSYSAPNGILSPGETFEWFSFKKPSSLDELSQFRQFEVDYTVCYKNVFGEYWTSTSESSEPNEGCLLN